MEEEVKSDLTSIWNTVGEKIFKSPGQKNNKKTREIKKINLTEIFF